MLLCQDNSVTFMPTWPERDGSVRSREPLSGRRKDWLRGDVKELKKDVMFPVCTGGGGFCLAAFMRRNGN
jgi:hypothetical protein